MWQDLADGVIEAGDPPLADIASALRERDLAVAEKPVPTNHDGAVGTWISATSGKSLTLTLAIPHAVPGGWNLCIPVEVEVGTGGGAPTAQMRIGANRGPAVLASGPGTHDLLLRCPIPAGTEGTEQAVDFWVQGSPLYQTRVNAADKYHAARASIRRPL